MTSTHYRLYMEYKGLPSDGFIAKWFSGTGFTITHSDGYWLGKHENSCIVDYVATDYGNGFNVEQFIKNFCIEYCIEFDQDCVMVTKTPVECETFEPYKYE